MHGGQGWSGRGQGVVGTRTGEVKGWWGSRGKVMVGSRVVRVKGW